MADFRKSGCCSCSDSKECKSAFVEFAAELCPKSKSCKSSKKKC